MFYLQEKTLENEGIFHGFFGREGGVSEGIYAGLNCGPGSDDVSSDVAENLRRVAQAAGTEPRNLLCVHQIHSDICLSVEKPWPMQGRLKADAMVTSVPEMALGVLSADCAPVLFYGENKEGVPVIGAAHAGWKGALGGILESTLKTMEEAGAEAENIKAAVGPCIGRKSYEVSDEFYVRFMEQDGENERFFVSGQRQGHYMFDLPGYTALRLSRAGVKNVAVLDRDTYADEKAYFSHRRSVHRGEPDYGRQISVIMIR